MQHVSVIQIPGFPKQGVNLSAPDPVYFLNWNQMPLMPPKYSLFLVCFLSSSLLFSCIQSGKPLPAGGQLPTNYIIIKDSSFSPNNVTVVSGSSITFVNNTSNAHTISSQDSNYLKPVKIESGSSYFFKRDTVGDISYRCMTHPSVSGVIKFLPWYFLLAKAFIRKSDIAKKYM